MPYKSDAQRRYFHAAAARGEIPQSVVEEWDEASKGKDLPERVHSKKKGKKKKGHEKKSAAAFLVLGNRAYANGLLEEIIKRHWGE